MTLCRTKAACAARHFVKNRSLTCVLLPAEAFGRLWQTHCGTHISEPAESALSRVSVILDALIKGISYN